MWKKIDVLLNCLLGSSFGVFIGHSTYVYWDYRAHPELYAMNSAPWYTGILVYGIITGIVAAVAVILKVIIWKRLK